MKKDSKQKIKIPSSKGIQRKSNKEILQGPYNGHAPNSLQRASTQDLRSQLRELKKMLAERQLQVMHAEKIYRMESFKNQNYKNKVLEKEKQCEQRRIQLTKRLIHQYQGNKESPLFYNENGLSPYQLMLLNYAKHEDFSQNICMTCFMDIQANTHIVRLPCSHILHRECGMQHLLYSKQCPACSQEIDIASLKQI